VIDFFRTSHVHAAPRAGQPRATVVAAVALPLVLTGAVLLRLLAGVGVAPDAPPGGRAGASPRPGAPPRSSTGGTSSASGSASVDLDLGAQPASLRLPARTRWIALGGGTEPASNQVSLEQDLGLARTVLGPGGAVLFAGGAGRSPVQVLDAHLSGSDLRAALGWLFHPRDGRAAHYRPARLKPDGPATPQSVRAALKMALAQSGQEPLLVFVAAHGEPGKRPRDNLLRLWGGGALSVADVDAVWRAVARPRPLRLVVTSCFAGGFAELAFGGADAQGGEPAGDRCGLFASTWDTEASGCDPNPDRRAQQSYGLYFLHALAGQDRSGAPLGEALDLDGDGRISLLEAHTRVRTASRSFSQPTTTSERWLRVHAPATGPSRRFAIVEEQALIDALGGDLGLPDAAAARRRLDELDARADGLDAELERREQQVDESFASLRMALLERWPVLDDPYHPDYQATIEQHRAAIARFIARARTARSFRRRDQVADEQRQKLDEVEIEAALVARLVRAHQTLELAGRLRAHGGPAWQQYLRLLDCERSVPARAAPPAASRARARVNH